MLEIAGGVLLAVLVLALLPRILGAIVPLLLGAAILVACGLFAGWVLMPLFGLQGLGALAACSLLTATALAALVAFRDRQARPMR